MVLYRRKTASTTSFIHLNEVVKNSSLLRLDVEKHIVSVRNPSPRAYSFETYHFLGRTQCVIGLMIYTD